MRKQRTNLQKEFDRTLVHAAKHAGMQKSQNQVFTVHHGVLTIASGTVHLNKTKTDFHIAIKPMTVDPVFWAIMDMPENVRAPLSLRVQGAFVCAPLPVHQDLVEDTGRQMSELAEELVALLQESATCAAGRIAATGFPDMIAENENFQSFGSYSETMVCALIADNRGSDALHLCREIATGKRRSTGGHTWSDLTFFELAIEWIQDRENPSMQR